MAKRSTLDKLPPEIREAAHEAIRAGATIDEITARIRDLGGTVSRSAVGRYTKRARDLVEQQKEYERIAEIWVREIGERPEGQVGRLVVELLRTQAMEVIFSLAESGEPADPDVLNTIALAIRRIETAGKLTTDRELAIRRDEKSGAVKRAAAAGREAGLSADATAKIRAAIEDEAAA